jgi:hypothetical protein
LTTLLGFSVTKRVGAYSANRERNQLRRSALSKESSLQSREVFMERRAFLQMLCVGMGVASVAAPVSALTLPAPLKPNNSGPAPAPEPAVATSEDMERAKVEKAYHGHWRRVNRRHYRRVSRRVYRRRHW